MVRRISCAHVASSFSQIYWLFKLNKDLFDKIDVYYKIDIYFKALSESCIKFLINICINKYVKIYVKIYKNN